MSQRLAALLTIVVFLISLPCLADSSRYFPGEAIINDGSLQKTGIKANRYYQLNRLNHPSFLALNHDKVLDSAAKVTLRRKVSKSIAVQFSKLRNPCNAPTIQRLLRTSRSLSCEPNWEVQTTLVPNDSQYSHMYAADSSSVGRVHLPEAWELSTGSSDSVVGIIDTGIDYNHIDLKANVWNNPGEVAANGIDDDQNGYIDDVYGIDTQNNDSDPIDDNSHGTHVAGTIGAVGNNSIGVAGINWHVKMASCKAFDSAGLGRLSAVVSCINYMVDLKKNLGANILALNNSYGGFPYSLAMYNAIVETRDADIEFVAGAGNNTSNNDVSPFYPSSYEVSNIISVAAIDSAGVIANFSNYGSSGVHIAAPGVSILSTIVGNQYAYYNGTSMATPHVTGAIALLRTYRPSYSYAQAKSAVLSTGTTIAGLAGKCTTGAILNVEAAMNYSAAPEPSPTETPTPTPTAEPGTPPNSTTPDVTTTTIDISSTRSRTRALVTCAISAVTDGQSESLPNREIKLRIKGVKTVKKSTSDNSGRVSFAVKPPKGKTYAARCQATLMDSQSSITKTITSRVVKVKLTTR